jgi:NAD(P)H-flavin reductase/predicted heme/steroid binding protein
MPKFTMEEVQAKAHVPWIVIDGKIYDCSIWQYMHPGGKFVITNSGGKDVSEAFRSAHRPETYNRLPSYYVGDVIEEKKKSVDSAEGPLHPEHFRPFWVKKVVIEADNCHRIEFGTNEPLTVPTGGHVEIKAILNDGSSYIRPYTPYLCTPTSFSIIIRPYVNGAVSTFVTQRHKDDPILIRGPFEPRVPASFKPELFKKMLLIAGGTGIAPIYTIAKSVLEAKSSCVLKFFNTSTPILEAELLALQAKYGDHFQYEFTSTGGDRSKYFNASHLGEKVLVGEAKDLRVAICGNSRFNSHCFDVCAKNGVQAENIYVLE